MSGKEATTRIAAASKGKATALVGEDLLLALGLQSSNNGTPAANPQQAHGSAAPTKAQLSEADEDGLPGPDLTVRGFLDDYFLRLAVKTKKVETRRRNERLRG